MLRVGVMLLWCVSVGVVCFSGGELDYCFCMAELCWRDVVIPIFFCM